MPTINYNIPVDKQQLVIDALRWNFTAPNATAAELNQMVEDKFVKERIRDTVKSYQRFMAQQDEITL